jgi:hypothetical protein
MSIEDRLASGGIRPDNLRPTSVSANADVYPAEAHKFGVINETGQALMKTAVSQIQQAMLLIQ